MLWLAIDLGTTSIKAAQLDLRNNRLAETVSIPFPPAVSGLPGCFREFDPNKILQNFLTAMEALARGTSGEIKVVLCGQMHGYIFMDDESRPFSNFMSWQDERSLLGRHSSDSSYFSYTNSQLSAAQKTATGNECHSGLPVYGLQWHREHSMRTTAGAWVASLCDFVVSNLCRVRPRIDTTHAAAFGLFNIKQSGWHEELIQQLGYDCWRWPEVTKHGEVTGSFCYKGRQISFFAPVADQQCALIGAGINEESISINVSTGSQVSRLVTPYGPGEYQTRPFIGKQYLNSVTRIPAGRSLNVLFKLVTEMKQGAEQSDWDYIERQVETVGSSGLEINSAFFPSTFGESGSIKNIREDNFTVGHVFGAAYANMACNYHQAALRVWPEKTWKKIILSGGISHRSRTLRELISRRFGCDVLLPATQEETLAGALYLARIWTGAT